MNRSGLGWALAMSIAGLITLPAGVVLTVLMVQSASVGNGCQTLEVPASPCAIEGGLVALAVLSGAALALTALAAIWRIRRGDSLGYVGLGWVGLGLLPSAILLVVRIAAAQH